MAYPKDHRDKLQIRLPDGMKEELQGEAQRDYRTLNAEIISLIERGLAAKKTASEHRP